MIFLLDSTALGREGRDGVTAPLWLRKKNKSMLISAAVYQVICFLQPKAFLADARLLKVMSQDGWKLKNPLELCGAKSREDVLSQV